MNESLTHRPFGYRTVLLIGLCLAFPFLLNTACSPPKTSSGEVSNSAKPPNILLILIDDLGWRDLGCYGSTFYETPRIDRLAAEGVSFTNAYSACVVCSPSRGSILTGRSPARTGLTGHINPTGAPRYPKDGPIIPPKDFFYLPTEEVTVAEALKPLGYRSLAVGKWHLGGDPEYWPANQGFDDTIGLMPGGSRDAPLHHYSYFFPYFDKSRSPDFEIPGLPGGKPGEYLTDRLTDETIRWLREHDPEQPFFIYLSHYAVHLPLEAPEGLIAKYEQKLKSDTSQKSAVYAAMVENVDTNIGRISDVLEKLRLSERTIIIFASDNGGSMRATNNAPLRSGKGFLYEGGIRVPFIVMWPGKSRVGAKSDTPVISQDIYPTIMEMVKASPGTQVLDGESLVPLVTGEGTLEREILTWYYPHYSPQAKRPGAAIRAGRFKLIENYDPPGVELFDLATDLGETNDLSESMPEKVEELRERLHDWLQSANTRMHTANPNYRKK